MALARAASIPVSIDPASTAFLEEVGPQQFLEWTDGADLLFPNQGEAALLSGTSDVATGLEILGKHYETVVAKLGADGAIARTDDGTIVGAHAVIIEAMGTTGAGNAFLAGFVRALCRKSSLAKCLAEANAAGARAAVQIGGQPV